MTEQEVRDWLEANDELLKRAIGKVERKVGAFIRDWGETWGFRCEQIEKARIKGPDRVHRKAERKGLTQAGQLLERGEEGEGSRFPVQDLLGVRVLVLSLNDVAALKECVDGLLAGEGNHYPLGNPADARVEDINQEPRPSGYRALHIDGVVRVQFKDTDQEIPFEIQVKTLAQHVFGQHTHDEAYVPDEGNDDPRYEHIRGLQTALAENLNGADLLLAKSEDLSEMVRDEILANAAGEELSAAGVANAVQEQFGRRVRDEEARRWTKRSLQAGITKNAGFAALIDLSGDEAALRAEEFRRENGRAPTYRELIDELLLPREPGPPSEDERARDTEARRRLDEPVPPNPLDELDPEVEEPG